MYVLYVSFRYKVRHHNLFGTKRHNIQAVELSHQLQTVVHIVLKPPAPSNGGPIYLGLTSRPYGSAGWVALLL